MATDDGAAAGFDPGRFWRLMSMRPIGAAVVAASHQGEPAGLLALSVSHLSAAPPCMLVSVGRSTSALATIKAAGSFAISWLPAAEAETAETFGGRRGLAGTERFAPGRWRQLASGAPVFADAVLALDCSLSTVFVHEDTEIIVGRIVQAATDEKAIPLVAYRGQYRGLALHDDHAEGGA